jgi:hypothetical protein
MTTAQPDEHPLRMLALRMPALLLLTFSVAADKAVARLVPEGVLRPEDIRRALEGLRELQQRIHRRSKAKLSNGEVRSAIAEERF